MSLLKSVRSRLFTSKNKKTIRTKQEDQDQDQDNHSNEESNPTTSSSSRNSLTANSRLLSLSELSLLEKLPDYKFMIKNKDPHDDWLDLKGKKVVEDEANSKSYELEGENTNEEYFIEKTYLNIQTETKSTCRLIKKFSNDCLDDYLVEIGILDESGYKFDEHIAEIEVLRQCKHKNILALYDVYFFDKKLWIFTEYCGYGSLGKLLEDLERPLSQIQIHYVVLEVLQGLFYLHDQLKICHNDIRANNILITSNGDIKIANFMVWAKNNSKLAKKNYFFIKSPHWIAPELARCKLSKEELNENFKADIWSLGITCIEMANLYPPNSAYSAEAVILEISTASVSPSLKRSNLWSSNFIDFVHKCLDLNWETRPNAINLFNHPFITAHRANKNEIKNILNERKFKFYDAARHTINEVETNFKIFKQMHEQPELFIYDHFQELRNQIDIESEKAKQYIETIQDEMISSLKQAEHECLADCRKKASEFKFTTAKAQTPKALYDMELVDENEQLKEDLRNQLNDWNQKLGEKNINEAVLIQARNEALKTKHLLEIQLDILKSKLFLKNEYTFQANERLEEYPFGKLHMQKNFLEDKKSAEEKNKFANEIDFKSNTVNNKMIRMELKKKRILR